MRACTRPPVGVLSTRLYSADPTDAAGVCHDASHVPGGFAASVAHPRSEADVAHVLTSHAAVLPVGAQSSVTGGATPFGDVVLSTSRLNGITWQGPSLIRAEAGVSLDALQAALDPHDMLYPPVPTWTGATVGGIVSTNAAGATTFKHGTTRDWVEALTVVLATGDVLDVTRGEHRADDRGIFEIVRGTSTLRFCAPAYRMPDVPKCSAGYFAAPGMDLIDLFIGSEGTLGVVTAATLRVVARQTTPCHAVVPMASESAALALVDAVRGASQRTWTTSDPNGIDVAAIEHMDARALRILEADGAGARCGVQWPADAEVLLLVQLDVPVLLPDEVFGQVGGALESGAVDAPLVRFCRLLAAHRVLDATELALPGDRRRAEQLLAVREAVPAGVNRRVADAQRTIDARIAKTAADMVVPFERFSEMMGVYREAFGRRGLDVAVWGHVSDGNVHPNVLPRSYADVVEGQAAILECGQAVIRMGGSPLAEHGVGRHPTKQALLRQLYGDAGIDQMRAIRRALDPAQTLARGVLFH